jgi:hypothetical protein
VHHAHLGGIVTPTVVALGKDIDQVDVPCQECVLELVFAKSGSHVGDVLRSVKIQVNLSRWYGSHVFSFGLRRAMLKDVL